MRPRFTSSLELLDDGTGGKMLLLAPLSYDCALLGKAITVPADFASDFASIPRVLWAVLPPHGKYDRAAILHDFLYASGAVDGEPITQHQADLILLEAMHVCGVSAIVAETIFEGVHVGGFAAWNGWRRKQAAGENTTPYHAASDV